MPAPTPGDLFDQTFSPAIAERLVHALRRAYETACEHHVPERGGNESTFGVGLYHYAVHELCSEADRAPEAAGMVVTSRQPLFRFEVGAFELACHRVGLSERESIWAAFPKNEGAACLMVEAQLWLPGIGPEESAAQARKLVLAHLGNADEGLRAVYLAIPSKTDGQGRIAAWGFTRMLFRADEKSVTARPAAMPALVPEEVIEAPVVTRKPKKTAHEAAG